MPTLPNYAIYPVGLFYHIEGNSVPYVPTYERFVEDYRFEPLVQQLLHVCHRAE